LFFRLAKPIDQFKQSQSPFLQLTLVLLNYLGFMAQVSDVFFHLFKPLLILIIHKTLTLTEEVDARLGCPE
jgi:hypothetical protein